jgi:hypothetical protein
VTQVLFAPKPEKWQPMPIFAPMAVQVAWLVVLPSVHTVAAQGRVNVKL